MTPFKPLKYYTLPDNPQNQFGGMRKYDIHTGVDLFCEEFTNVYSMEDGVVLNDFQFTGEAVGSPWWNDTFGLLIRGSYTLLYGEIIPKVSTGDPVVAGQIIGWVRTVLKKDKGLPMTMLYMERYSYGYEGTGEVWNLDKPKPKDLLDVTPLLT